MIAALDWGYLVLSLALEANPGFVKMVLARNVDEKFS
jgi:hypothetical protein